MFKIALFIIVGGACQQVGVPHRASPHAAPAQDGQRLFPMQVPPPRRFDHKARGVQLRGGCSDSGQWRRDGSLRQASALPTKLSGRLQRGPDTHRWRGIIPGVLRGTSASAANFHINSFSRSDLYGDVLAPRETERVFLHPPKHNS